MKQLNIFNYLSLFNVKSYQNRLRFPHMHLEVLEEL